MRNHIKVLFLLFVLAVVPVARASAQSNDRDSSPSPTVTSAEASDLISVLPVVRELRAKGMEVEWDSRPVPDMNNATYYFFWVCNATAQKQHDIASISVGNYAVNKHTADVRVWTVSPEVFHGDDGTLITSNELERLQAEIRNKHGVDATLIQEQRFEHLAAKIIPRDEAQSAMRLPITDRSTETAELSCWKDRAHFISREGRTAVLSYSNGGLAYAEVSAIALKPKYEETYAGPLCENSITLFVAKDARSKFQIVLDSSNRKNDCGTFEGKDLCDVNGVSLVDWSKDGRFLLVELVAWEYETDGGITRVPILYDIATGEFTRPDVYKFFDKYYWSDASKKDCEFDLSTRGFSSQGHLIVVATRPPVSPTYDQVFCFSGKQTFDFQLGTGKITRLPETFKVQQYGTKQSGDVR
jgi:hypothetical protein